MERSVGHAFKLVVLGTDPTKNQRWLSKFESEYVSAYRSTSMPAVLKTRRSGWRPAARCLCAPVGGHVTLQQRRGVPEHTCRR